MSQSPHHSYEFGPFRLDEQERLLLRAGESVSLTPKAFDMLLVLVEQHGHLLEKEALFKAVWPDSFVEESNLSSNKRDTRVSGRSSNKASISPRRRSLNSR